MKQNIYYFFISVGLSFFIVDISKLELAFCVLIVPLLFLLLKYYYKPSKLDGSGSEVNMFIAGLIYTIYFILKSFKVI